MTNKKSTKKALLSSVLALLLCLSMLIGTTFAWFTDSVTSGLNKIVAGNLDVELEFFDGDSWETVNNRTDLFTGNLWEPGHTEVIYLKLSNLGSLALKYQLSINIASEIPGTNVAGDSFLLSDYIYMGVVADVNGEDAPFADRDAAVNAITDAKLISTGDSKVGYMLAGEDALYMALVVYMPESVGNEANHKTGTIAPSIDLGINLIATQKDAEQDSFGDDYDKLASVTVEPGTDLKAAINSVEDGGIVFLENGVHNLTSGPIVIENKTVTIVGLGEVTINKNYGSTHIFTVQNGANVTIENVTMDGKGNTREGVYVRWNSKVTLKDVVIKNTGGKDIMIDEASDVINGYITETTYSVVNLKNSKVEDVAICAAPTVDGHIDTFVYFNYDAKSYVGSIEKQDINLKPENIYINGDNNDGNGTTMYLNVSNDAELKAALELIQTNSAYWNNTVIVNLAAGEYSADHVINQYPGWNGTVGAGGTNNNYATGVAGKDRTNIIFVGANPNSRSNGVTKFTGNVTVNGFGNAGTGFDTAVGTTTFQNILFDASKSADNAEDSIVMYVAAAANNVNFVGCTFENATHIRLGGAAADGVGAVSFDNCTFNDGGCLSGYVETLNVTNSTVTAAKNGFINKSKTGDVTIENCDIKAGKYFLRTSNSGINMTVTDTTIEMYESEGKKDLVYFRGSNESAEFTDCTIAPGYTYAGVDANSTLEIYNFSIVEGVTYYTEAVSGAYVLYDVSKDAPETLVIPEGITTIGGWSFGGSNVKTVVMPSTLTKITKKAFDGSAVEKVVLNEGLEVIDDQAFSKASNLKEITFPSTLKSVGSESFRLAALETLTIPATLTNIGTGAFRDLPNLTTVVIEGNPTIANYAFRSCANLTSVTLKGIDVKFSGTSMAFSLADNAGDMSKVTFYVENQVVADRLAKAQGSAKGYNLVINSTSPYVNNIADGLFTTTDKTVYGVTSAEGLAALNQMMKDKSAGQYAVVNLLGDIDFSGKTWTPVDSHADSKFFLKEFNGNGYTISNLTVSGQAMFTRFAGFGDVVIKDITFENANINSNSSINTAILTGHTYQNVLLDNVDVKNSTITGGYKVAPLIATVYNEGSSTITATLKNCDVENVTVKATSYDFCTTGMVAFVYADDNDKIEFENCTVTNVKLYAPNVYTAHAAVYTTGSDTLFNEADGVTVTNVTFENI